MVYGICIILRYEMITEDFKQSINNEGYTTYQADLNVNSTNFINNAYNTESVSSKKLYQFPVSFHVFSADTHTDNLRLKVSITIKIPTNK